MGLKIVAECSYRIFKMTSSTMHFVTLIDVARPQGWLQHPLLVKQPLLHIGSLGFPFFLTFPATP